VQYLANITVGGQVVTGIIDTGSFELVVFEQHCNGCGLTAKYDHNMSVTYQPGTLKRSLYYGSGDLYAREAFDLVSVGAFGTINQSVWESYEAYMPLLDASQFQSIIGVGPPEMPAWEAWAATRKSIQRLETKLLRKHNHSRALSAAVGDMQFSLEVSRRSAMLSTYGIERFSLCLGNRPASNGYLVWNDTSVEKQPESFKHVPVIGRHTWTVNMTDAHLAPRGLLPSDLGTGSMGTIDLSCSTGCGAIIDSGTSFLMMPSDVVNQLQERLTALDVNCSNVHELPDLVFKLGEHTFSLPPDAYLSKVIRPASQSTPSFMRVRELSFPAGVDCDLTVLETTSTTRWGPLWILGMPFFRKYYTTFSLGRTKSERALFIAKAGPNCYPASAETALALDSGQEVFRRHLDLMKAYVSPLVKKAFDSSEIEL